LFSGNALK